MAVLDTFSGLDATREVVCSMMTNTVLFWFCQTVVVGLPPMDIDWTQPGE